MSKEVKGPRERSLKRSFAMAGCWDTGHGHGHGPGHRNGHTMAAISGYLFGYNT